MPGGSWGIRKNGTRISCIFAALQFRQLAIFTGRSRILTIRIAPTGQDSTHKKAKQIYNLIRIHRGRLQQVSRSMHQVSDTTYLTSSTTMLEVSGTMYQVSGINC